MFEHQRIQDKLSFELGETILGAINDPNIIEIMLNEDGTLWVDSFSGMSQFGTMKPSQAHNMIRTIASSTGAIITRDHPYISGELKISLAGTLKLLRFQALIPPLVANPIFAIRKPASYVMTLAEYLADNILDKKQYETIKQTITNRKNILVVGGTGSGKTTFCNALLAEIAQQFPDDRVAIIEDTLELQCKINNKIQLRTSDHCTMNDLLRFCLRLRPDRIVVGEVRGQEAHALTKAWNTGHPGGVATIHANDALRGVTRMEQLIQEAGIKPSQDAIAEAVNCVIYIAKTNNGSRKVKEIISISAYDHAKKEYVAL